MPDPVQTLGKQLITELGMSTSCDTLARWLVHDVASLMKATTTVSEPEKPAAREECRSAILKLLSHIHALPAEARHMQSDVAIMDALGRLAPEHVETSGYYTAVAGEAQLEGIPDDTAALLKTASLTDTLSRRLIRTCLRHAARLAMDHDTAWVKTVESIADYDHGALRRINLVAYSADTTSPEEIIAEVKKQARERRASELADIQTMRKLLDGFEEILQHEAREPDDYAAI